MKLTAPIHILKQRAKALKRSRAITMVQALDNIAQAEGYSSWSLLQSRNRKDIPKTKDALIDYMNPGDLVLIGARPGLGKTTATLALLLRAARYHRLCYFFSLEYTRQETIARLGKIDPDFREEDTALIMDFSDEISSDYIIAATKDAAAGTIIAIDYLQLLDRKRTKPAIQQQIESLKEYAHARGLIFIFLSQIDRNFNAGDEALPDESHIRQANPFDVRLFNKLIFVKDGALYFERQKICA